jgi:hypothetical protein
MESTRTAPPLQGLDWWKQNYLDGHLVIRYVSQACADGGFWIYDLGKGGEAIKFYKSKASMAKNIAKLNANA